MVQILTYRTAGVSLVDFDFDGATGDTPELNRSQMALCSQKLPAHVLIAILALADGPSIPETLESLVYSFIKQL